MGKSKEERCRYEGAGWAIAKVKELGLEKAEAELKSRGALNVPLAVTQGELERFQNEIKKMCLKTICCMTCLTLLDEFEFDTAKLAQFIKRFNKKTDVLETDWSTWTDYAQILWDECGIDIDPEHEFQQHDEDLRKNREAMKK